MGTMQVNIFFLDTCFIDSMIRFYTWVKSIENAPLPSQRKSDIELGQGSTNISANKGQPEHPEDLRTDEKDVK